MSHQDATPRPDASPQAGHTRPGDIQTTTTPKTPKIPLDARASLISTPHAHMACPPRASKTSSHLAAPPYGPLPPVTRSAPTSQHPQLMSYNRGICRHSPSPGSAARHEPLSQRSTSTDARRSLPIGHGNKGSSSQLALTGSSQDIRQATPRLRPRASTVTLRSHQNGASTELETPKDTKNKIIMHT